MDHLLISGFLYPSFFPLLLLLQKKIRRKEAGLERETTQRVRGKQKRKERETKVSGRFSCVWVFH